MDGLSWKRRGRGFASNGRPGERVGLSFAGVLRPLLPARYRAGSTDALARTLLAAILGRAPGVQAMESERIA